MASTWLKPFVIVVILHRKLVPFFSLQEIGLVRPKKDNIKELKR